MLTVFFKYTLPFYSKNGLMMLFLSTKNPSHVAYNSIHEQNLIDGTEYKFVELLSVWFFPLECVQDLDEF